MGGTCASTSAIWRASCAASAELSGAFVAEGLAEPASVRVGDGLEEGPETVAVGEGEAVGPAPVEGSVPPRRR
jgi:hypothetical protein